MGKKDAIKPEDKDLFRQACANVKPIHQDKILTQQSDKKRKTHDMRRQQVKLDPVPEQFLETSNWLPGEASLEFKRANVRPTDITKLRKGTLAIDATLDLHGLTGAEAIATLDDFIEYARQSNCRCVLIIHGKSHISGKPILKNIVNQYLPTQANILAFYSAKPKHGGSGAIYVLLKRKQG